MAKLTLNDRINYHKKRELYDFFSHGYMEAYRLGDKRKDKIEDMKRMKQSKIPDSRSWASGFFAYLFDSKK